MSKFTLAEYIWIDGAVPTRTLRSKTRAVALGNSPKIEEFPEWSFDGSSTNQAVGDDSDCLLQPVYYCKDPIRGEGNFLVMCEVLSPDGTPHESNSRAQLRAVLDAGAAKDEPWCGFEQEYTMFPQGHRTPLGWPQHGYPAPQGPYYCSVGYNNTRLRAFMDDVLEACLDTNLGITGYNLEVCPGQAEFQVCAENIRAADDSLIFKYIVQRVGEDYKYNIDFSAKPVKGDWNGSGCHVNFSTKTMREADGYSEILKAIDKLSAKHNEHIAVYGSDNVDRLTGKHETSDINTFSSGVADRGCSIRIPRSTIANGCGYFEDRRPSSSADMYLVTSKLAQTCLDE